jgi:hypothetical protein
MSGIVDRLMAQANKEANELEDLLNEAADHIMRLDTALSLIAAPMRPDGTWNRDREACRQLAEQTLKELK